MKKNNRHKHIETDDGRTDKLYDAAIDYIESRGGKVLVIGGTAIIQEDPLHKYNYGLIVRFMGTKPECEGDSPNKRVNGPETP